MALFNEKHLRRPGFYLALISACCVIVVVVLGAFTRLVDAGLGCPDWPTCYGHLWIPNEAHEIVAANEKFSETPVETDKTWPEQIHRIFAGTLGLLIAALAIFAIRNRELKDYPFRLPVFLVIVVVWQAIFGMWTVTLKLWPQIVTLHLFGGFTTLTLLWLLTFRLDNRRWQVGETIAAKLVALKPLVIVTIVVVVAQILLGGWMSSNYAAVACGVEFPTCHAEWWPPMDIAAGLNITQDIGPNYLGGQLESEARTAIHMLHRVGAIVASVVVIVLALRLFAVKLASASKVAWWLLAVLGLQIALGISNVIFAVPLAVAVLHNAVGALLLVSLAFAGCRIWTLDVQQEA